MYRLVPVFCIALLTFSADGQTPKPSSDAQALALAAQAIAALTGGVSVNDAVLNANVVLIYGSDNQNGTGTFKAKGMGESRIDLTLAGEPIMCWEWHRSIEYS